MKRTIQILLLVAPLVIYSNCSKVAFKEVASTAGKAGEDDYGFDINQPPGTTSNTPGSTNTNNTDTIPSDTGSNTTSQLVLPKVQASAPPCYWLSQCQTEFRLDKAYNSPVEFDWRTDDAAYLTPHTPIYAQPGVHYTSTSGHLVFNPGETSKSVSIQNINASMVEVNIRLKVANCKYLTYLGTCKATFFQ